MSITPAPGWQVNAAGDGVIPIPGYNASAPTVSPAKPASADNPVPTSTGVQDGPYTPAQVAAAVKSTSSAGSSSFSSSALGGGAGTTASTVASAGAALSGQPPPNGPTFSYGGQNYNFTNLPNGMSLTPQTGQSGWVQSNITGPDGSPLWVNTSVFPNGVSGGGTTALPTGITAGQTDAKGNTTYSGNNVTATLPSNSTNANTLLTTANTIATDNPGSQVAINPDGSGSITIGGVTTQLGPNTFSSPSSATTAVSAITASTQANSAATQTAQAQIATINTQLAQTLQNLQQQQDAAEGEAGAGTGGFGKGSETGAAQRYDELIQNAKDDAQNQIAEINAGLASTQSTNASNLSSQLADIEQKAQSTTIGLQQQAQSNFTTLAKTFDVSTASMPSGQNLSTLTIGANGTTGVASVDALVAQGVQAGYTPQQALSLVQAGVATQNKNNQAQFLGLLQQASYANGWATADPATLASDPLFNAYVGMAQSYIPSLANNPAAAQALVSGGSIQQQKLNITATGSPTGATPATLIQATPPDPSTSNTTGVGIAAGTKYTPSAIYEDAIEYAITGKVPSLGLGSSAQVAQARAAINNVAGAIVSSTGTTFPALQALYKANSSAATQSVQRLARISIVENSATSNFPRLETLADSVKAAGITITESDLQAGSAIVQQRTGSADAASYVELVNTIRSDYSAMQSALAGARGGQYFSETAAQAIPLGLTSSQYAAISNTITLNAQNATAATNGEVQDLLSISGSGDISSDGTVAPDGSTTTTTGTSSSDEWPGF